MIGAVVVGKFLDYSGLSRKKRMTYCATGLVIVNGLLFLIVGVAAKQRNYWGDMVATEITVTDIISDPISQWGMPILANVMFGIADAYNQTFSYWAMGQLTDNITVLGAYAGYYKFVQNIVQTISNYVAGTGVSAVIQIIISFALIATAAIFAIIGGMKFIGEVEDDDASGEKMEKDILIL